MEKQKLGRSQKPVFDLIRKSGPISLQEIGDRLYATTSSCAKVGDGTGSMGGKATDAERRRAWAQKIVVHLRVKHLVTWDPKDKKKYILSEEGKAFAREGS